MNFAPNKYEESFKMAKPTRNRKIRTLRKSSKRVLTFAKMKLVRTRFGYNLGGVYMTPARLSPRSEFTPVLSHGSIFVYMIPPQNAMRARVTPVLVPG